MAATQATDHQPETCTLEPDHYKEQAARLLRLGLVDEQTTFGELDGIIRQDFRERAAIAAIKTFFDDFCIDCYTAAEGNFAAELMLTWLLLDPQDFIANCA